ncbi:MAG TPA: hypothetical protein VF752_11460 [Thermoleophilaceae bacterium]
MNALPQPVPEPSAANEIFIARQPIYDRQVEVFAYELLFRDGSGNSALVADGEAATARVIGNAFTEMASRRSSTTASRRSM